ncbi:Maltose/maltodextrin transport permease homologue [Sorangium cellulosum So ce56]|uniref:Maltose/maltodextrin transport permease homologue n=1 Tax=Sorangium cellulosum (strain So ce56) TaxID=448385 RepID=A9FAW0_SORC5|nr:extracellular solute-binding protein [Sorangium cellulosum]CAN97947.1 Maltose/maltodextrin transport permease homologue [Sorangium cellulosum So ce56]
MPSRRCRLALALAAFAAPALILLLPALAAAAPIRLWHAYRDDEARALDAIVAAFEGEEVEVLAVPFDAYASKLQAAIPMGEGPDLFIDAHERLGDFRARHLVAPVGDALEPGGEAVFLGPALAAVRQGGEILGLPISQKCVALYMNTALVKEAPATLEDIAALAGSLPEGVYPLAYEASNAYAHMPILAAFGGAMLGEDDQFGFVGPGPERSLELVRTLIERRVVPEDANGALVTDLFNAGRAAFVISGPWFAGGLGEEARRRARVVPLPKVRETGLPMRPFLTVEAVMLSPQGARRAGARALARHLAGAAAAATRLEVARTPPVRSDVAAPAGDAFIAAFTEQAKAAIPMPTSPAMRSTWEPATRAIRKVLRGDAPPDVALSEAKRRFDDVRRPLPPPASPAPLLVALGALALLLALRWVRAARDAAPGTARWRSFRRSLKRSIGRSIPAYKYVAHAVVAIGVLVVIPLVIGAATSLFAGRGEDLRYVGLANFISILTARGGPLFASGSFYLVLAVTVLWTAVNLCLHVLLGVSLALLLHRPTLRLRALYRVLLIVPWAVPSYVTALSWKGMFHRQFGAVTGLIEAVNSALGTSIEPISWFSSFTTAFTANVATNVWLGFPFMMVVTLGALTAVPEDVLEAAEVDGATRWQRLRKITLPLIRPVLAPAVTLGAIWTFNMFNVVFLVSGGDPDGTTDILVSEAYRWAFTREAQYGYAAAYSVLIFLLLTLATRDWRFRRRRTPVSAIPQGGAEAGSAPVPAAATEVA